MKRRAPVLGLIVVAVALAAGLSTARAHQLDSENHAQTRYALARHAVQQLLVQAQAHGLSTAQLAPLASVSRHLSAARVPSALPIIGSERIAFYDHQRGSFRRLARRIRAVERAVTAAVRERTARELTALAGAIGAARVVEANTDPATATASEARRTFQAARYPTQFFKAESEIAAARASLAAALRRQQTAISSVLQRAGGNRGDVAALARERSQSMDRQLSLLSLFSSRADQYRRMLTSQAITVQAQKTPTLAAVKELHLETTLTSVAGDYGRTVPDKFILVSTESQSASLYQNGAVIYSTPVTTGGPELPTDHGVFHIYLKASPFMFHSPWPPGSPYYYSPTPVTYWMPFYGGEGLHDASWRSNFGPGSNLAQTDLGGGHTILGTHGCVNLPSDAAGLIWNWAPVGTAVVVV